MRFKTLAQRHEAEIAEDFGGRVTAGSGAHTEKGDVWVQGKDRSEQGLWEFVIENKVTQAKSFSASLGIWQKVKLEAQSLSSRARPLLAIRFADPTHPQDPEAETLEDLVVMSKDDLLELIEENQNLKETLRQKA